MSEDLSQQSDIRFHEELLQRFYDGVLTEAEAETLLTFWDKYPELMSEAGNVHSAEIILRQMAFERHVLSPRQLDELKSSVRRHFGIVEQDHSLSLPSLAFDFLPSTNSMISDAVSNVPENETPMTEIIPRHGSVGKTNHSVYALLTILLFFVAFFPIAIYLEFNVVSRQEEPEQPPHFTSVACISGMCDVLFTNDSIPIKLGQQFQEEDRLELPSGKVELQFKNNIRMVLEGPSSVKLISSMNVFCDKGRLSVTVPPEGKGFEIASPKLTVRDLGTEFVMDITEDSAEVHVIKGEVEANWLTKDWIPLKQGNGVRAAMGNMSRIAADRSLFVLQETMRQWTRAFLDEREKTYDEQTRRWQNDPLTCFFLNFEPYEKSDSKIRYQIRGCRRVRGEWGKEKQNESGAVEFKKRTDVVRISLENRPRSFTLLSTLKIDWTNRYANMIFVWRGKDQGKILWKVNNSGMIQLVIDEGGTSQPISYDSPVAVSTQFYGVWLRLATTVDSDTKTVRHYLNGQKISEHSLKNEMNISLNDIELGNWTQKGSPTNCFLNGSMDDFLLYEGILDETDITP